MELLHIGHGLSSVDFSKNFRGQSYPELLQGHNLLHTPCDQGLFGLLQKMWVDRFEKGRKTWRTNRLFRSLAIAYHACSLPKKNSLWFYDFGVSVALWISAFEILAHPGRDGSSGLPTVLDLLSKARFSDSVVRRRRKIKHPKTPNRIGNAAEYLYLRLYKSRNAFLHGNPVTFHDALYKNRTRHLLLTSIAPVLYTIALLCHFDWFNEPSEMKLITPAFSGLDLNLERHFSKSRLEKALKHILAGKDRRLI
jgi:hypothetical protein